MSLVYTSPVAAVGGSRNSVYIGGRADAKSLEKLERWGISRILNVTPAKETSIQVFFCFDFEFQCDPFLFLTVVLLLSPFVCCFCRLECPIFSKNRASLCTSEFQCTMPPLARQH
jgi:hypothetical protein